ncbi:MAG: DinB family protein [Ignavibacteriae bacterium]|nr:DinB family protein [Ignavibacteriota bacterium]
MYKSINDFLADRKEENGFTLKMLGVLTDESLKQKVWAEGRTLGYLAWHITLSIGEMMDKIGLAPDCPPEDAPAPAKASEIYKTYEKASASMMSEVSTKLTDKSLNEEISAYGQTWKKGMILYMLSGHEIHHRGQLTVLMRQAGLKVPGIFGPAKEEWAAYGMQAPE